MSDDIDRRPISHIYISIDNYSTSSTLLRYTCKYMLAFYALVCLGCDLRNCANCMDGRHAREKLLREVNTHLTGMCNLSMSMSEAYMGNFMNRHIIKTR